MYVVGITGGIGSGKSAVTDMLARKQIQVIDADIVAREVVEPGEPALQTITEHFGQQVLTSNGALDRAALRKIIFSNPEERTWLEQLLHPQIRARIIDKLNAAHSDYAVLASPLLLETDQSELVEHVVVIDVPTDLQLKRTMTRDNNSEQQVKAIIQAQLSREARNAKADSIICNDQDLAALETKVESLHQKLITLAQEHSEKPQEQQ